MTLNLDGVILSNMLQPEMFLNYGQNEACPDRSDCLHIKKTLLEKVRIQRVLIHLVGSCRIRATERDQNYE